MGELRGTGLSEESEAVLESDPGPTILFNLGADERVREEGLLLKSTAKALDVRNLASGEVPGSTKDIVSRDTVKWNANVEIIRVVFREVMACEKAGKYVWQSGCYRFNSHIRTVP
jgi:hypothetical protein